MRGPVLAAIAALLLGAHARAEVPRVEHVFVLVEENQDFSAVIGEDSPMPYLNELASRYAVAASYYATAHPSISNYFMLTTGQAIWRDLGAEGDGHAEPIDQNNVVRALRRGHKTWKSYAEGLPHAGYTGGNVFTSHYVKRHNPLAYFEKDLASDARTTLLPIEELTEDIARGRFANYSFIVPDMFHDGHDVEDAGGYDIGKATCGSREALGQADRWLREKIRPLVESPVFAEKGLLLIVFDEACESDRSDGAGHEGGGRVPMVLIGGRVRPGYRSIALYHHEDTLRLTLEALGIDRADFPGVARDARSMAEFFPSPEERAGQDRP